MLYYLMKIFINLLFLVVFVIFIFFVILVFFRVGGVDSLLFLVGDGFFLLSLGGLGFRFFLVGVFNVFL